LAHEKNEHEQRRHVWCVYIFLLVQRFIKIFFVRCCILFVLAAPIAAVETAKRNSTNDKGKGAMSGASIFFYWFNGLLKISLFVVAFYLF
jgi:hypothetical protein